MFCSKCGSENSVEAKFYKSCSAVIETKPTSGIAPSQSQRPLATSEPTADYGLFLLAIPVIATALIWNWVSGMNLQFITGTSRCRYGEKEVWEHIRPKDVWGQGCTKTVVKWISKISALEIQNNRSPLNVIVTPANKLIPNAEWGTSRKGIKAWLEKKSGLTVHVAPEYAKC